MLFMPRAFPEEFRRDVVAVARRREAPQKQIAEDFGISHATLSNWLRQADIEDGDKPGVTREQSDELRVANRRIRLLEQENEVLRRASAYLSQANLRLGGNPK
jgi:transposase-like protein